MKRQFTPAEIESMKRGADIIEKHTGPDRLGRWCYTVYWWADYRPGHPDGEGPGVRGQVFFCKPRK